jgi:hypothetical protein
MIVVLSAVAGTALLEMSMALRAAGNRIELARAEWARAACWSLVRDARTARDLAVDSLRVGVDSWCSSTVDDLGARVQVNIAPAALVECVVGVGARHPRAARPLANDRVLEALMALVRQKDRLALLTTRGDGVLNLNTAPPQVLACIPGVGRSGASSIARLRQAEEAVPSVDALIAELSPAQRAAFLSRAQEWTPYLGVRSRFVLLTVSGHAGGRGTRAIMRMELQHASNGFLASRREVE